MEPITFEELTKKKEELKVLDESLKTLKPIIDELKEDEKVKSYITFNDVFEKTCNILGNLIDNAIEARVEEKEPYIELTIKQEKSFILIKVVNKYSREANERLLNKTVPVLIDGKSEKEGMLSGYTNTNKLVNVKLDESYIGKIVNVKITDVKTWSLDGVLDE